MLAADLSLSFIYNRNNHFPHLKIIQTYRSCCNINNRIHCTHFMKMYLIHRLSMHTSFCLCQDPENLKCQFQCIRSHISSLKNPDDLLKISSMMSVFMDTVMMNMLFMAVSVKILHIVVMIIMLKDHIKIANP